MTSLPTVVVSSVVRSTNQGDSHGGVYLVDLESGVTKQVIDWDDAGISWEGRGADRGLRGIAFHGDHVWLAASDEVFAFNRDWERVGSIRNRYLKHCHEIDVDDEGVLWLSSTGYNSVLGYDLAAKQMTHGYHLSYTKVGQQAYRLREQGARPVPKMVAFDPESDTGPEPGDKVHINNVVCHQGDVYVSGTEMGHLLRIDVGAGGKAELASYAKIPYGTHNSRPFRDGVLMNDTASDGILWQGPDGETRHVFLVPRYDVDDLELAGLPTDHARQAFGRGLAVHDDRIVIGGSSPATVTARDIYSGETLAQVNLTMDVRNAVHGLEIWPF